MGNTTWWYIMRSAGITSWVLLTLTIAWGAIVSGKLVRRGVARQWIRDLHPYLGALGLATLALHIVAAVVDTTVHMTWTNVVIPFTSSWRPLPIALGVVGVWMLVVVELTSIARRHLKHQTWHRIHLASYAMGIAMSLHALTTGTDMQNRLVLAIGGVLGCGAVLVAVRRASEKAPNAPRALL